MSMLVLLAVRGQLSGENQGGEEAHAGTSCSLTGCGVLEMKDARSSRKASSRVSSVLRCLSVSVAASVSMSWTKLKVIKGGN